ncbi:DUF1961 family protein [Anditalea andensis]|uniref:DUF1961 family protein n=1 Tax=Anditalea andensis TaxID=1048983 RepID=UPI00054E8EF4|nr:DUF6250 domain-containing protein [Anditalea andensis]
MTRHIKPILFQLPLLLLFINLSCTENKGNTGDRVIFQEDFSSELDPNLWVIEMDNQPNSSVRVEDGKLVLDTKGGVTVWLNRELDGDFEITYERTVVMDDGPNDRLSDLNQFWLANDPNIENLFTRSGVFEEYDDLEMYYVGFGGNYNSSTRFRKYKGEGEKPVLQEYDEAPYLLAANKTYRIKTVREGGKVSFWVDDRLFFEYEDPHPIPSGYFGFRSTWSRHEIDYIKITRL